jgi:hypothetical protein
MTTGCRCGFSRINPMRNAAEAAPTIGITAKHHAAEAAPTIGITAKRHAAEAAPTNVPVGIGRLGGYIALG